MLRGMKKGLLIAAPALMLAAAAQADTIAITEFQANPAVISDTLGEYIEIFNYGTSAVTMTGWSLTDEDSDSVSLPTITIASGAYVILARDAANWVGEWGVGTIGVDVFDYGTFTMANSNDEIELRNGSNNVVWSLAYATGTGPSSGISSFLAVDSFAITVFGSKASPGVNLNGDDNGIGGFLGYENNNATTDPFAFTTSNGNVGSPLAGGYTVIPAPGALALLGVAGLCARRRRRA